MTFFMFCKYTLDFGYDVNKCLRGINPFAKHYFKLYVKDLTSDLKDNIQVSLNP